MKRYFDNINTLEELRKQYKDLLRIHHPDNGGNVADMQDINAAYDRLFKVLKDKHQSKASDDSKGNDDFNNMKYDFTEDQKLREVLQKIISFEGIVIEICGNWIWISGNSYTYQKELKEYGFKWASQKKQWYWHSENFRKKGHKSLSMEDIRSYYGSTKVQTDKRILLEA